MLRALMVFALVTSVGEGTMSTLFTPFVEHVLHGSPQDLGLIVAAQAIGGIGGGMIAAASGHRFRAGRMMCYGAVAFGLVDLAIFLYPLGYVAVQGGGYVVAGLAMLVWLREEPGTPRESIAGAQGEPALVAAEG